jgi:hypothetical protein
LAVKLVLLTQLLCLAAALRCVSTQRLVVIAQRRRLETKARCFDNQLPCVSAQRLVVLTQRRALE